MEAKRKARAMVRRAAVEVLARTHAPDSEVRPAGDLVLLLHHMPDEFLPKMDAVVDMMQELATPATYTEICKGPAEDLRFCVTFDDGNLSQVKAAKRLADVGVSACFFIIADALDADQAETDRICREQLWMDSTPFMVRDDLDKLLAMGHEIGSHTRGHVNLSGLSDDQLADQIGGSKEQLSQWLGDTAHFAWPFGGPADFTERAYRLVAEAGYASCATGLRGMGVWRPVQGALPLVFRQSLDLRDSLAVQRRFLLNSDQHVMPSKQALAYLQPVS